MEIFDDPVILELDALVRSAELFDRINEAMRRTTAALRASDQAMSWEVIPLDLLDNVPRGIHSCWVFLLRAGQNTGAERHPNSHQRSLSLIGDGAIEIREAGAWVSYNLSSGPGAPVHLRWASIPPDTWHQWQVGSRDWALLSFHTVAAEELIEERPAAVDELDAGQTQQNRYQTR